MDILIDWAPYEATFKGEVVSMELRPLLTNQYKHVLPYMRQYESKDEAAEKTLELLGKALPIFQGHVRNIKGLTINGSAPTPEQLKDEAALVRLAQDIIQELFIRSTVTEEERKNSGAPSGNSRSEEILDT